MQKWIKFNIKHPKIILSIISIISIISLYGLFNLRFDSSTEALLPKDKPVYKMGQKAKKVFGDSKTFLLTVLEPKKIQNLLSYDSFKKIDTIVSELNEFKDYDPQKEKIKIDKLLHITGISLLEENSSQKITQKKEIEEDDSEEETISSESTKIQPSKNANSNDLWHEKITDTNLYAKASRKLLKFDFTTYQPIALKKLLSALDQISQEEIKTILKYNKINLAPNKKINQKQIKQIFNTWNKIAQYKSMPIIKTLMNPISGQDMQGINNTIKAVDLVPKGKNDKRILPKTKKDFQSYIKKLKQNPEFKYSIYTTDKNNKIDALAINIELKPLNNHDEIFGYFYTMFQKYDQRSELKVTTIGMPVYMQYIRKYMIADMELLVPLVILVVILTFFLNFRLIRGVMLPTASVIIGTMWTLGLIGFLNIPLTILMSLLPPVLVAIGSSYSIHIFNQYINDQSIMQKKGKAKGLEISMKHISLTVVLAALTTFVSFLTLSTNDVNSLRNFGIFAAIGTLISMVIAIMLIPSALSIMKLLPFKERVKTKKINEHQNIVIVNIIRFFSWVSIKKSIFAISIFLIFIIIGIIGITKIEAETSPAHYFKKNSYLITSDIKYGASFKGSVVMDLIIDSGKTDGALEPKFLNFIEKVRNHLKNPEIEAQTNILNSVSFGDIIKRMNKAMNNENPKYYTIPSKKSDIADYLEIFGGDDNNFDGRVDSMEQFIDPNFRYVNTLVRIGPYNNKPYTLNKLRKAETIIKNYFDSQPESKIYKMHLVGEPLNFIVLADYIIHGQIISVLFTLLIIFLMILFLFKNVQAGFLSLIPIATSIILVYGFMGFFGIKLDIAKAILAAIAIGIGVDDTIHFMKTLKGFLQDGLQTKEAIIETYKEAGMAIIYTSVALILGFSMLLFSKFLPFFDFAWLVVSTMAATTISALVLLPSVIIFFNLKIDKELNWKLFKIINFGKVFDDKESLDNKENKIAS